MQRYDFGTDCRVTAASFDYNDVIHDKSEEAVTLDCESLGSGRFAKSHYLSFGKQVDLLTSGPWFSEQPVKPISRSKYLYFRIRFRRLIFFAMSFMPYKKCAKSFSAFHHCIHAHNRNSIRSDTRNGDVPQRFR